MLTDIFILVLLILVNGFFSCAELAVLSVNHNKIRLHAENGDKKAQLIKYTLDNPDRFMSTIQIAISLVGLFTGAYAGQTFAEPVVKLLLEWGIKVPEATLRTVVVVLITVIMSYFTLVFGELVPKKLALQRSEKISFAIINPINFLSKICYPFVKILSVSTNIFVKLLHLENKQGDDKYTEEEIRMLVDAGSEIGSIDEDEMEMINNIFEFDDKTAQDICTHRTDIVAIDIDSPHEEIVPLLIEMKYSRFPVYEESIDNIIGILHIKDFMRYLLENKLNIDDDDKIDLKEIVRDAYFVPTSKRSDELFTEMQKNKVHLSIVVDEYGGTVGIVSMEDLIEEVMGNIFDEYDDEEEPEITEIDANTFDILGSADLDEVAQTLNIALPEDDYDTLSGFLISQLGRIPEEGETPEIEFNNVLFKIVLVEEKRIAMVRACRTS